MKSYWEWPFKYNGGDWRKERKIHFCKCKYNFVIACLVCFGFGSLAISSELHYLLPGLPVNQMIYFPLDCGEQMCFLPRYETVIFARFVWNKVF